MRLQKLQMLENNSICVVHVITSPHKCRRRVRDEVSQLWSRSHELSLPFVKPRTSSTNTTSSSSELSGGYVKGVMTSMLMDNITLIKKFNVKDVSSLEEKEVRCFKEVINC